MAQALNLKFNGEIKKKNNYAKRAKQYKICFIGNCQLKVDYMLTAVRSE